MVNGHGLPERQHKVLNAPVHMMCVLRLLIANFGSVRANNRDGGEDSNQSRPTHQAKGRPFG